MCTERGRGGMREVRSDRCTPEKHPDLQPDNVVSSLFYDRWFLMVPHMLSSSACRLEPIQEGRRVRSVLRDSSAKLYMSIVRHFVVTATRQ